MAYKPQYYPGNTSVAKNRRKHMSNGIEKLRDISDEDLTATLGHRAPGSEYPSTHPPLSEMGEPDCPIREIVEPTPGAAAGDRLRYVQFADSMYNAPATPYWRSYHAAINFRGCDPGTLSGRQIVEMRERDLEEYAKRVSETEITDWGLSGMRGCTVHGHSLRLQEDGTMFDMLDRRRLEGGVIVMDKDQVGVPIDRRVNLGKPMSQAEAAKRTTIYRLDNVPFRIEKEVIESVQRIWEGRTLGSWVRSPSDKEHWLASPPGWQGAPFYMRYLMNTGLFFVVSLDPPPNSNWIGKGGYHIIRFNPETGFCWEGSLYPPEPEGNLPKVSSGNYTYVHFAYDHVYIYDYGPTLVDEIRIGNKDEDSVSAIDADNWGWLYLVTVVGEIYHYKNNIFYRKYSPIGGENLVIRTIILKQGRRILIEKMDSQGYYSIFLLKFNWIIDNYDIFELRNIPLGRPPNARLGRKHVELNYYAYSGVPSSLVITGDQGSDNISILYFPNPYQCHLVKYKDSNGELHERYNLGAGGRDWDFRLKGDLYQGIIYMIAALTSKKVVAGTLDLTLNVFEESYFQISSQEVATDGDVYCVFWADEGGTSLINPRFEIFKSGGLRFRGTTMPEPVNPNPMGRVEYKITVVTGNKEDAGTDAKVYITLYGKYRQSEEINLWDLGKWSFEKGKTDIFYVHSPFLDLLNTIRIRHDNTGTKPGWYLDRIIVEDAVVGMTRIFICDKWLDKEKDDGIIDRILSTQ